MGRLVRQKGHSVRKRGVGKVMRCSWEGSLNEKDREELVVDGGMTQTWVERWTASK